MIHRRLAVAGVSLLHAAPLSAQQELWRLDPSVREERFGSPMAPIADVDGDGVRDLLVGAQVAKAGAARVVSGATLATLCEARDDSYDFPTDLADAGDVDGDGVNDFLAGAPDMWANGAIGKACLFSGRDGSLLAQWSGTTANERFGRSVVALGDVDGDGVGDVAIGAPGVQDPSKPQQTSVQVFAGAGGALLWRYDSPSTYSTTGVPGTLANAGDVNGDGIAELAVIDRQPSPPVTIALLLDGATGAPVWSKVPGYTSYFVRALPDFDGDAIGDLLFLGYTSTSRSRAFILSGADGHELWFVDAPANESLRQADSVGDRDGDGLPEFTFAAGLFGVDRDAVTLHRGSDGALLGRFEVATDGWYGPSLVGGLDVDGDGLGDVTVGLPTAEDVGLRLGRVAHHAWPGGQEVAGRFGEGDDFVRGTFSHFGDLDGDGATDGLVVNHASNRGRESVRFLSGRDGSVIEERRVASNPGGAAALPDVDGDGVGEYAVAFDPWNPTMARVEVFSGSDGQAIATLPDPGGIAGNFGSVLAAGVQPSGAVHLAVAAPGSDAGTTDGGAVVVFDAATGAVLFQKLGTWSGEKFGTSVAYLGDVNGDSTGDWAFGAPQYGPAGQRTGRVLVVSGAGGGTIATLLGANGGDLFGRKLAAVRDLDGDGLDELAVTSPNFGTNNSGRVEVLSGGSWTPLSTVTGAPNDHLGWEFAVVRDVNGDGADEWVARGWIPERLEVRSGATGDLLARFHAPPLAFAGFGDVVSAPRWQTLSPNGDSIADLFVARYEPPTEWLAVIALDDLLLQIEPESAPAGATVVADLRGGPPASPCGWCLVAVNGVPVNAWLAFGAFGTGGAATISDVVPPGLAGTTITLQGFAIGFDGRVKDSPAQTLTFE